jgi:hypothetical protein
MEVLIDHPVEVAWISSHNLSRRKREVRYFLHLNLASISVVFELQPVRKGQFVIGRWSLEMPNATLHDFSPTEKRGQGSFLDEPDKAVAETSPDPFVI